jgi:hypothetical protein
MIGLRLRLYPITADITTAAIMGFEQQERRIDDQIAELRAMLPGGSSGNEAATELLTPSGQRSFCDVVG